MPDTHHTHTHTHPRVITISHQVRDDTNMDFPKEGFVAAIKAVPVQDVHAHETWTIRQVPSFSV
jgi:hypothetical protein